MQCRDGTLDLDDRRYRQVSMSVPGVLHAHGRDVRTKVQEAFLGFLLAILAARLRDGKRPFVAGKGKRAVMYCRELLTA
jgi:hypothetical protein